MTDKQILPSVAEFAVEERQRLLSKIEAQAKEIERLNVEASESLAHLVNQRDQLRTDLAALKAQPSGVVLPERKDPYEYSVGAPGWHVARAHNACLDEVARLNSSPVSAGLVDERAAFEAAWAKYYKITLPEFHPSKHRAGESYNPEYSPFIGTAWWAWQQARAALSADSQGGDV